MEILEIIARLRAQEVTTHNREVARNVANNGLKKEYDRGMAIVSTFCIASGLPVPIPNY